jgi:hypothetical protein
VLHAGMGVGGFFWDHAGTGTIDTLFFDYMAYTAPNGNALLNIKPMYADTGEWPTLDAKQGTIITRQTPSTAIVQQAAPAAAFKNNMAVRLSAANGHTVYRGTGILYTINGQRYYGKTQGEHLPAGIYIEKK